MLRSLPLPLLLLVACNTEKEDTAVELPPADCAWSEGDNCWKETLEPLVGVLPELNVAGVFDATATTCTYPDGLTITLGAPHEFPLPDGHLWDILITKDGTTLLEMEETEDGDSYTTSAGTFRSETAGIGGEYVCPSGDRYRYSLATMEGCNIFGFPGWTASYSYGFLQMTLTGGPDGELHLFTCDSPEG